MIPNKLWQTWKSHTLPDPLEIQSKSWNSSNPQLEKIIMDDTECASFILEHFGEEVHYLYISLPQPIMRADFWRLAAVYVHGGYYSDLDITCNRNINEFINPNVKAVFTREINNISNYFFGAEPGHPVLKIAIDYMIEEAKSIGRVDTQSFGMHPLHHAVRVYYNIVETEYTSTDEVHFILDADVRNSNTLVHSALSLVQNSGYESWRDRNALMLKEREQTEDVRFVTTFNLNGYELYGKTWVKTFIAVSNYYTSFKATIYYEGFEPEINNPNITWVRYEDTITMHPEWKSEYLSKTAQSDYVRSMCVRFSHKAFVIQHALENNSNKYLIWLDGDCVFKNADYTNWPSKVMDGKFLACQVEHAADLNHIESGILIFETMHPDTKLWNQHFKDWYSVDRLIVMGEPYDGFIVSKALITSGVSYVNLNEGYGKGGIQSDPNMTFQHPEISSKFIHNIGWTGKNQYDAWSMIYQRDDIYQKMKGILFGHRADLVEKKERAFNKFESLRQHLGR